jgi:hypothetical protein
MVRHLARAERRKSRFARTKAEKDRLAAKEARLRKLARTAALIKLQTKVVKKNMANIKNEAKDIYAGLHMYRLNFISHCREMHLNSRQCKKSYMKILQKGCAKKATTSLDCKLVKHYKKHPSQVSRHFKW